jgi:hypothetical protein
MNIDVEPCSSHDDTDINILSTSLNRSGCVRQTKSTNNFAMQFDYVGGTRPSIRGVRNFTCKIKDTLCEISVKCNLSNEAARHVFQTVCSSFYGHAYYISKEEAIENDPALAKYKSSDDVAHPPPHKISRTTTLSTAQAAKLTPHSLEDWRVYEFVLPSSRVQVDYKQSKAIHQEKEAAMALYSKPNNVKSTLHYDTTSRSQIDGDWPALILIFSDKRRFSLRPLFFAFEDRKNIIRLFVETYTRLASAVSTEAEDIHPRDLWQKTDSIMTDSVSKNLNIGQEVTKLLGSTLPPPNHLLCKSHPVEAFDRSNLSVLAEIENNLEFRKKLESINPAVKSFLRGKTTVVQCAITSILSLVSHDKSARSSNQADLFDFILQRENQVKRIAMYHERRFTKLGYCAGSIIQSFPYLRMLLNETHLSNQHVEIVRLLLDSEFLLTELEVLAYFTHKVTLPFLYFLEVNSQEELLIAFPKLYADLLAGKLETLKDYVIHYPHIPVVNPTSALSKKILHKMCIDAAEVFDRQAGREYGFGKYRLGKLPRATELNLLTPEKLRGLPTNNLEAERHLAGFGKRAAVAKFRNKNFTAKGIRNDCTLLLSQSFRKDAGKGFHGIVKLLNEMEKEWYNEQKQLHNIRIGEKIEKGKKSSQYTQKCLQLCKGWGGPATSVEELHQILRSHPDMKEKIVRNEVIYYRDTHKSDVLYNPSMFKVNNNSHEERLVNLCALLAEQGSSDASTSLPTNRDAEVALESNVSEAEKEDELEIEIGKYYVTLMTEGKSNTWYIASCERKNDNGTYQMDHLMRLENGNNFKWKHPRKPDIMDLHPASILDCDVDGEWDVSNNRFLTFSLRNHIAIASLVEKASLQMVDLSPC